MQLLSNEEGTVNVGDQVPIITSDVTNTSSATITGTTLARNVTYKNTGTILKVTPRISRGGRIMLNVTATVS